MGWDERPRSRSGEGDWGEQQEGRRNRVEDDLKSNRPPSSKIRRRKDEEEKDVSRRWGDRIAQQVFPLQ